MNEKLKCQLKELIKEAIQDVLLSGNNIDLSNGKEFNISQIIINNGTVIEVYLKVENELHQILNQQLNLVLKSLKLLEQKSEYNESFRKIGWLRKESELHDCYKILDQFAVIGATKDLFIQHFTGNDVLEKGIQWYEKNICLPYLFHFFKKNEIIPPHDNIFVLLSKHFCDSKGNCFDAGNLRKNYNQGYSYNMFSNFDYLMKALKALFNIKE